MEMMQRFGVPELVPPPTQQSSDMSAAGTLDVGRLGLYTDTGTNSSDAFESTLNVDSFGPQTSTRKRPAEMEIDDSEDEKRQRT